MEASDTVDGGTSTAPAAPTFSVPVIQEAVKLAIAPAVQAAVQEALAAAVAQGGTSGGAGGGTGGSQGGSAASATGPEAVAAALLELTQVLRSTEGRLVGAVQDSTQQLLDRMDAHALEAYNLAVDAHNQGQRAHYIHDHSACTTALPRKNSAGQLPPAGLFPMRMKALEELLVMAYRCNLLDIQRRNRQVVALLRFYGAQADGEAWPAEEELPADFNEAVREFDKRTSYLRALLRLY